jgi:hypothetical protein
MDFDDMPDSYFAFLSNQRKLAEPDKINGAMRDLANGSAPPGSAKGKVKSRASQPQVGAPAGSKPSVPSLPSIQRTSTQPAAAAMHQSGPNKTPSKPGSRPPSKPSSKPPSQPPSRGGSKPPSSPQLAAAMSMRMQQAGYASGGERAMAQPGKGNGLVFTLVGVLVAAIVVLAYLVLTK